MIAILNLDSGGPDRNRTDVRGFAVPCIATLPPGPSGTFCPQKGPHIRAMPASGQGDGHRGL